LNLEPLDAIKHKYSKSRFFFLIVLTQYHGVGTHGFNNH
jgi:hypothetical protein